MCVLLCEKKVQLFAKIFNIHYATLNPHVHTHSSAQLSGAALHLRLQPTHRTIVSSRVRVERQPSSNPVTPSHLVESNFTSLSLLNSQVDSKKAPLCCHLPFKCMAANALKMAVTITTTT